MRMKPLLVLLGLFVALRPDLALSQQPSYEVKEHYTKYEYYVPMRDGKKLFTSVYVPKDSSHSWPFLMVRTPYSVAPYGVDHYRERLGPASAFDKAGYIFVFQDVRGRYMSEGKWLEMTPHIDNPKSSSDVDESTDTYDTVEWLLKNIPNNNGRVGLAGTSYGAWLTVMGTLDPHPALKAAVEQASPADMWIGDDFHHNGAFRLSYGFEYAYRMESSKEQTDPGQVIDRLDAYDWYLHLGPLSNVNKNLIHEKLPTWNDFVNHPDYDAFWKRQGFAPWLNRVTVPTLNVAGWWDQEDFYGPMKIYELLERHDTANQNFLVVGPWNHGGWSRGEGRKLGRLDFGSATSEYYRKNILTPFLAFHLKGKGKLDLPEALTFRTGTNEWVRHESWPPKQHVTQRDLYFHEGGTLSFDAPASTPSG